MKENVLTQHEIHLFDASKLEATGITEVKSYDESRIDLVSQKGLLVIIGDDIHIEKLSLETKEIVLTGRFFSVNYTENDITAKKSFFSKLFK